MLELESVGGVAAPRTGMEDVVDLVSTWVETLHGQGDCQDVLRRLAKLLGASGVELLRFDPDGAAPLRLVSAGASTGRALPDAYFGGVSTQIDRTCGLRGLDPARAHWIRDLIADESFDLRVRVEAQLRQASLVNAVVIVLERRGGGQQDLLELQYRFQPTSAQRALVETLARPLARRWAGRQPGIARHFRDAARPRGVPASERPAHRILLGHDNPAGLTRAEYRICVLLRDGVNPTELATVAGVRPSTAKSHLRAIYEKTGCRGRIELVQRMLRDQLCTSTAALR